jgi:hypothetical protein
MPQEQVVDVNLPVHIIQFNLVEIIRNATLVIFTHPTNAEIFVNNVFVGFSTLTHEIPPGSYRVTARLPGYTDSSIDVTLQGEEELFRTLLLSPTSTDPWDNLPPPVVDPPVTPLPPDDGNP